MCARGLSLSFVPVHTRRATRIGRTRKVRKSLFFLYFLFVIRHRRQWHAIKTKQIIILCERALIATVLAHVKINNKKWKNIETFVGLLARRLCPIPLWRLDQTRIRIRNGPIKRLSNWFVQIGAQLFRLNSQVRFPLGQLRAAVLPGIKGTNKIISI